MPKFFDPDAKTHEEEVIHEPVHEENFSPKIAEAGVVENLATWEASSRPYRKKDRSYYTTIAILVISFGGAFFVVDSPAVARAKAYDQTRVSNLEELGNIVNSYYLQNDKLPEITDLESYQSFVDPKSGQPYEYKITGEEEFELCAVFETSNKNEESQYNRPSYYSPFFFHTEGRNCFTKKIEKSEIFIKEPRVPEAVPAD